MSLKIAAEHLKSKGRGPDTELVHMTKGEIKGLRQLALAHGTDLTINPETGLPEAGMLSSVLPMALGALAVATGQVEFLPLIAAGVGAADYAITGSLTQGLMAGLGTWSGGSLYGAVEGIGTAALEEGAKQSVNAAVEAGGTTAAGATVTTAQGVQAAGQAAADAAIKQGATEAAQETARKAAEEAFRRQAIDEASQQLTKEGIKQTAQYGSQASRLGAGLSNAGGTGIFNSATNAGNFAMNNKAALAGVAAPLIMGGNLFGKNSAAVPGVSNEANPMGMKQIPRDENGNPIFNASIPAQPNPAYTPVYPNYVKNPYVANAAGGGLMNSDIPRYKGSPDYGSMVENMGEVERGIEMATKRRAVDLPTRAVEIAQDEPELSRLDPHNRARKMLEMLSSSSKVKLSKGLPQSNVLGAINTDPAQMIAEQRAKQAIASEQPTESKEGGLMSMATGGTTTNSMPMGSGGNVDSATPLTGLDQFGLAKALQASTMVPQQSFGVYQPQYTDYTSNPFNMQQAMQYYNSQNVPNPSSSPLVSQPQEIGSQGYRMDPSLMQNNAQIAEAKRLASLPQNDDGGGFFGDLLSSVSSSNQEGSAAGGLMGYAMGGHLSGNLGNYSDGGRLLKGPGDGVSDSIPATIGGKQPARLATGEFVIPARIVSELGNGSTDAGAKRLYAMMDRIKAKRAKTKNIAADTKAYKYLPA